MREALFLSSDPGGRSAIHREVTSVRLPVRKIAVRYGKARLDQRPR